MMMAAANPAMMVSYDPLEVALSVIIAVSASYPGIEGSHISSAHNMKRPGCGEDSNDQRSHDCWPIERYRDR